MPISPKRPCKHQGCPGRAMPGSSYCQQHRPARQPDTRPSAAARGYDQHWRRIRAAFLRRHPICSACGASATEVDHIVPIARGGTHAWSNLQPFCKSCHSRKTAHHDGSFGRGGGIEKSEGFP